jgi:hypothetical protein
MAVSREVTNAQEAETKFADWVIVNANVWTPVDKPPAFVRTKAAGLAIAGDKILAAGSEKLIQRHIGPATRVVDAHGRRIVPGLTDSHTHIISGGLQLTRLNLRDVRNREEFIRSVQEAAKGKKAGEWVLGGRWSAESWSTPESPRKEWIDPVTGEVPVYLNRMDGHQALVNSAALKLAGISAAGPPDPQGGQIERDPKTGEPTGILKEAAMDLVERLIPAPTFEQRYEALRRAMNHANSLGVTSIHDMSEPADLEVFRRAHADGALTVRVTSYVSVSDWPAWTQRVRDFPVNDDWFRVAGFKGYMDGSLGSRTAYMREPYADAGPDSRYPRGQLNAMADPPERFRELVIQADAAGLQLAVHAIGDEANRLLLDAYEAAAVRNGRRDARHRIEHAQHLRVEDIPRFASLGVTASMQPFHKADDGRYAEKALGADRLKGSYAFRQLVDAGALLAFGSDFPVVTLNPFAGIDAAVNSRTLSGETWLASHSLSLDDAFFAYTTAPARAIHRGDRLGTFEDGKYADFVILAADPWDLPPKLLGYVKVWQTVVGGKVVYAHPE